MRAVPTARADAIKRSINAGGPLLNLTRTRAPVAQIQRDTKKKREDNQSQALPVTRHGARGETKLNLG
jgi:hypothetical protein